MALAVVVVVMAALGLMVNLVPGDPVRLVLGQHATPELTERTRQQLGLDDPVYIQVWEFASGAFQGDFGEDWVTHQPIAGRVAAVLPDTLLLAFSSIVLAYLVGVPLGILAARFPNGWLDRTIGVLSIVMLASLPFIASLALLLVFAVGLGWLPAVGAGDLSDPLDTLSHLVLPASALAVAWIGYLPRFVRASMLEVLTSPYVRAARAFGFRERFIAYRFAAKAALVPVVALFGLALGYSLAGTVIVEAIFLRPGLGTLALEAFSQRNWPIVRATTLVYALFFVLGNLTADLSYRLLDPRVRVERGGEAL